MKSYLAYIRMTMRLTLRDRLVLFFNYVFPLILFFALGEGTRSGGGSGAAAQLLSMVLILSVLGSGFFGGGMRAVAERENNVLRRYKVAPISPAPILVSSIVTGWITWFPSVILFLLIGIIRYGLKMPEHLLDLLIFLSLGVVAFRSLGMIIASVVNSMAESQVVIQLLYLPMLLLSGATIPLSVLPEWLQSIAQFIPTTHLYLGMQSILVRNEGLLQNLAPAAALVLTTVVAFFLSMKLFRWEKEEKLKASAKLWLLAVMAPFLLIGVWQTRSHENLKRTKQLTRELRRSQVLLIRDARVVIGDGTVKESASVLIRNGKIEEIYEGRGPDLKELKAEPVEAAGKTLLPGLFDTSVNLALSGGGAALDGKSAERALRAYLFNGVTAVRDAGSGPMPILGPLKAELESAEKLGAELFFASMGGPGGAPSLVLAEASAQGAERKVTLLGRSLFLQTGPKPLLDEMQAKISAGEWLSLRAKSLEEAKAELKGQFNSGIPLVLSTRSGALLLPHGPAIHREMQLWVAAGIPAGDVLQAATGNGAKLLGTAQRSGFVRKGYQADLLLVEGNPLEDISNTERIVAVVFRGEDLNRSKLVEDDDK